MFRAEDFFRIFSRFAFAKASLRQTDFRNDEKKNKKNLSTFPAAGASYQQTRKFPQGGGRFRFPRRNCGFDRATER
ncbi:MAG TPA: hypothetical protein DC013_09210 [Ruminococcaceae bacterium]|nr:hypothetical protein [Oscillospiraceae bacterium]